jgi:hypothetical protein
MQEHLRWDGSTRGEFRLDQLNLVRRFWQIPPRIHLALYSETARMMGCKPVVLFPSPHSQAYSFNDTRVGTIDIYVLQITPRNGIPAVGRKNC